MKKIAIIIPFVLLFVTSSMQGQGCSDAGFCTIDAFQPEGDTHSKAEKNLFKVGLNFGSADNDVTVFGQYLEYTRFFSEKFSLNTKLTSLSQSTETVSNFGLSDIYVNGNFSINEKTSLTAGFKIPFTDGNDKENRLSLPMDFQSSLGTFDLILGINYKLNKVHLSFAYQQPLSQNSNQFVIAGAIGPNSTIFTTNKFKRAGDVLLRVSYPVEVSEKLKITPSLLPIYHLAEDKYTNLAGQELAINGSNGLTLNANAYFDYKIDDKNALQLNVGFPLKTRDARPDGLTRSFVANLEYSIRF